MCILTPNNVMHEYIFTQKEHACTIIHSHNHHTHKNASVVMCKTRQDNKTVVSVEGTVIWKRLKTESKRKRKRRHERKQHLERTPRQWEVWKRDRGEWWQMRGGSKTRTTG